jgi:hypothetical protein
MHLMIFLLKTQIFPLSKVKQPPFILFVYSLAEAGLISSNLSKTGMVEKGMQSGVFFEPDRYSYIL